MPVSRRAIREGRRDGGCRASLSTSLLGHAAETLDLGLLPTVDEVWAWQTWMAKLGPKYTPSPTF
jgi:hypothetical protein